MTRLLLLLVSLAPALPAQDSRDAAHYFHGGFNWAFRANHPEAARLFNAFDYGHAVLYERLLTLAQPARSAALEEEFAFLVGDLLVRPPRFGVVEEAIAPAYSRLAWPAVRLFDAAHVLHRQIYDIYAAEGLDQAERARLAELVTDWYLADPRYAIAPVPKAMSLMDDQPFSQRFRREEPRFNGLIWAYHWLQVGLYEPLVTGADARARTEGVDAVVAGFRAMVADPDRFPTVMPMTAMVAPTFARRHPRAAAIFDNLHMMHDIISDILATPTMTPGEQRAEILRQVREIQDRGTNLMEGHVH